MNKKSIKTLTERKDKELQRRRAKLIEDSFHECEKRQLNITKLKRYDPIVAISDNNNHEEEKRLWKTLKEYIENKTKQNTLKGEKTYFDLTDLDCLNISYNTLFVLGKKNIGKSYNIRKIIRHAYDENQQFIYLRLKQTTLNTLRYTFFNTEDVDNPWPPLEIICNKGTYFFRDKKDKSIKGYLASLSTISNLTSIDYPLVKYIIFDEAISYKTSQTTEADTNNFTKFLSTVIRNRKDCILYLFGNLIIDDGISDMQQPFLSNYSIGYDDNLRYIITPRRDGGADKLLYINFKNLYVGIEDQTHFHQTADINRKKELITNTLSPKFPKIINPHSFFLLPVYCRLILQWKGNFVTIDIRHRATINQDNEIDDYDPLNYIEVTNSKKNKNHIIGDEWVINITNFKQNDLVLGENSDTDFIYTNIDSLKQFGTMISVVPNERIENIMNQLRTKMIVDNLFYVNDLVMLTITNMIDTWCKNIPRVVIMYR